MAQNKDAYVTRFQKVHREDAENTLNNDRSPTMRTEKDFGVLVFVLKFWITPLFPVTIAQN